MWKTKIFKTKKAFNDFVTKNQNKYQMTEVFVNNAYAIEYKPLIKIL